METGSRAQQVKKKQMIWIIGSGAILLLIAVGVASFVTTPEKKPQVAGAKDPKTINLVTGGSAYSDREAWRLQLSTEMGQMKKDIDQIKQDQAALLDRDRARRDSPLAPPMPPGASEMSIPKPPEVKAGNDLFAPPTPPSKQVAGQGAGAGGDLPPGPARLEPPGAPGGAGAKDKKKGIGSISFEDPKGSLKSDGSGGEQEKRQVGSYIPAGSFVRVAILSGLDAPTGGQAQQNPTPVLMRIVDPASLPNGFGADLKDCIVTANGYGDVSAERAYVRADRLSCVDERGGAIDVSIKGYVAGEDGKAGMRGRLVTKTGQLLANALIAGIGSGIGEAFKNSAQSVTQNPLGGTTTVTNSGEELKAGLGTGVGKAFDTLSKYYITLADKTFPIIEVDGGRVADLVISKGFILEGR
jgi:conjugal transfer pilus assembly protein TraB